MSFCKDSSKVQFEMKKQTPLVKKRANEWEHEIKKSQQHIDKPFPLTYGDRFVARRYPLPKTIDIRQLDLKSKYSDVLQTRFETGYWRWHNLKVTLDNACSIKKSRSMQYSDPVVRTKILSSFNVLPMQEKVEVIYKNLENLDWPCYPRARPVGFADSTHDLPGFGVYADLNIITWSTRGQIAASFGRDLVLWNPKTDNTIVYKIRNSKAVEYNPAGDILAVGCIKNDKPVLELWNVTHESILRHTNEYIFRSSASEIRCLEWDHLGKIIVCGTKVGSVHIFEAPTLKKIKKIKNHKLPLFAIKFSPKLKYIATSDVEGNIYILLWDSCEIHVRLISQRRRRTIIDWHPWNGADLAISEDVPASIVILNVPSREIVAYYQRKDYNCQIDSIKFSAISGELAVSYTIKNSDGCLTSEIVIMASLDRIVDVLKGHEDRIKFMMWSPDGLQLATAGVDDALTIWNFFAHRDKSKLKSKYKKHLRKPLQTRNTDMFHTWSTIK